MDERASTLVVVGASAGGVEALTTLAEGLPADLDAAVCVVLHLPAGTDSRLADIISRAGPLPAVQARGGERLAPGRIYACTPRTRSTCRPRTTRSRSGGATEAVSRGHPDRVLPLAELAAAVTAVVRRLSKETSINENGSNDMTLETQSATLDAEIPELLRSRCRVGHAYTADGAVDAQAESVETALRTALRALQERTPLSERLAERVGGAGAKQSQASFEKLAGDARTQAEVIRRLLAGNGSDG